MFSIPRQTSTSSFLLNEEEHDFAKFRNSLISYLKTARSHSNKDQAVSIRLPAELKTNNVSSTEKITEIINSHSREPVITLPGITLRKQNVCENLGITPKDLILFDYDEGRRVPLGTTNQQITGSTQNGFSAETRYFRQKHLSRSREFETEAVKKEVKFILVKPNSKKKKQQKEKINSKVPSTESLFRYQQSRHHVNKASFNFLVYDARLGRTTSSNKSRKILQK